MMKKLSFLKNYQLIFSLILIILIPSALLLHNYFVVKTIKKNMDTEFINKAALSVNILKNNISESLPDYNKVQDEIERTVRENPEIIALDFLVPVKDNFKIVASLSKKNIGKILNQTLNNIAWKEEFITFTTNTSSLSSDQRLKREDYQSNTRYQVVVKVVKNKKGDKVGLLSMKISLKNVDDLTKSLIFRSYFTLIILVIFILLLIFSNSQLFQYAVLFQKLKEVDQMKDDFISIASHELRAPLTVIKGYASMMQEIVDKEKNDNLKNYLKMISLSIDRLGSLVEDMLDVSRIEQNRIKVNPTKVNASQLVKEISDQFVVNAKQKNLKLVYNSLEKPAKEAKILVDVDRFKQIIVNIISNAIKYTLSGGITISTKLDEEGKNLLIKIRDTGIGMNAKQRERLFQKFYRIQNEKTRNIVGTGLGLWITKKLVQLMKGEIFVDSIEGQGTEFTVSFPIIKEK